jgi:hypothetical protein
LALKDVSNYGGSIWKGTVSNGVGLFKNKSRSVIGNVKCIYAGGLDGDDAQVGTFLLIGIHYVTESIGGANEESALEEVNRLFFFTKRVMMGKYINGPTDPM